MVPPVTKALLAKVREMYKIPSSYDDGLFMTSPNKDVVVVFNYCDADITVNLTTGKATHTHMGLNSTATGHEFITRDWEHFPPPEMPPCPQCKQSNKVYYRSPTHDLSSYECLRCNTSFLP